MEVIEALTPIAIPLIVALSTVGVTIWVTKLQNKSSWTRYQTESYRDACISFLADVDSVQFELDLSFIGNSPLDSERYRKFLLAVEKSRVNLDLMAPAEIRLWAYRIRLAIEKVHNTLLAGPKVDEYEYIRARCLLHCARAETVSHARDLIMAAPDWADLKQPLNLKNDGKPAAHQAWLESDPVNDAEHAVRLALESMRGPGSLRTGK